MKRKENALFGVTVSGRLCATGCGISISTEIDFRTRRNFNPHVYKDTTSCTENKVSNKQCWLYEVEKTRGSNPVQSPFVISG